MDATATPPPRPNRRKAVFKAAILAVGGMLILGIILVIIYLLWLQFGQ